MENSIEEDIKILEEFIEGLKQYNPKTGKDIKPTQFGEGQRYVYSNVYYAIDHILSDYRRVLKENEELKDKYAVFVKMSSEVIANSIPVQKVKDKIEELNKKEQKLQNSISDEEREECSDAAISFDLMDINIRREALQELLEGRK